ncbi:hypothetical protein H6P81_017837 [Aristolochia fimbriata]|uniref:Uncharacterized protein n=1 Tax=Aristolochia fimbriata TaxID=158543 RepID=A0AAV7DZQ4_ARIFI|nr:hypothetical protein H6P81_017837 [Aristolochia fimbriata]
MPGKSREQLKKKPKTKWLLKGLDAAIQLPNPPRELLASLASFLDREDTYSQQPTISAFFAEEVSAQRRKRTIELRPQGRSSPFFAVVYLPLQTLESR